MATTKRAPSPTLEEAGDALAVARLAELEARTLVRELVVQEAAKGVPETRLAVAAGVDRLTIRVWLGKGREAKRV